MNMDSLEDDNFEEFKGGTLEINQENPTINSTSTSTPTNSNTTENDNNLNTNINSIWRGTSIINLPKKLTESLWSCKTSDNETQAIANLPNFTDISNENVQDYFTFRDEVVEKAVMDCVESLVHSEEDGDLVATFLLTEITTWDTEKERLVILSERTLYSVKYDFIALKRLQHKRVSLNLLDSIDIGDLVYPSTSLVPDRKTHGIRIHWSGDAPIAFTQRWNPFNSDVPFITFTSHPLNRHADSLNDNQRSTFSIDEFAKQLISTIERAADKNSKNTECFIHHKDILLQSYVGLGSFIYNRNALGFFKVRGKFSF